MFSFCIVVDLNVDLCNIKPLSFVMEGQQCFPFVLLSRYKIFRTAVSNVNVLRPLCKVPHILLI